MLITVLIISTPVNFNKTPFSKRRCTTHHPRNVGLRRLGAPHRQHRHPGQHLLDALHVFLIDLDLLLNGKMRGTVGLRGMEGLSIDCT